MARSDPDTSTPDLTAAQKIGAYRHIFEQYPLLASFTVILSIAAALFEGVGIGFILPIIEIVQGSTGVQQAEGGLAVFTSVYTFLGIPFSLGYVVLGVSFVMLIRFTMTFLSRWMREILVETYMAGLQQAVFEKTLGARTRHVEQVGSQNLLNAILTQSVEAKWAVKRLFSFLEASFMSLVYIGMAILISPWLTLIAGVVMGLLTLVSRGVFVPGDFLGEEVADANENLQHFAQEAIQGIKEVKSFRLTDEFSEKFTSALEDYRRNSVLVQRNREAINSSYNFLTITSVFGIVYVAVNFSQLTFGAMGVFLVALFRLSPKISGIMGKIYSMEGLTPHIVRTRRMIEELAARREPEGGREFRGPVERLECNELRFSYNSTPVLKDVSFSLERPEFVGFVGPSGAGKSTIAALLAKLYRPDDGRIVVNGEYSLDEIDVSEWWDKISVVFQNPYVFNRSLWYNLTLGHRSPDEETVRRICEIAAIDEFFDELPNGYGSRLGEDGVRLSGGQRQRVTLARALLQDADLLILDEATSELDSELEERIHNAIMRMDRDFAVVAIAHRLSTVINADRLYFMEAGEIMASGPHEKLLDDSDRYRSMFELQYSTR